MNRILIVCISALLIFMLSFAFAEDYSYLDGMSLDQLTALQKEVEERISASKDEVGESDPTNTGVWQIKYYVDEFNNPTSEGYITTKNYIIGSFSNSATTNSTLYVIWLIDNDSVAIKLAEYGSNIVKSSYDDTDYSIIMLDPSGNKINITGTMYEGSDRIYIDYSYKDTVLTALRQNASVSFRITEEGKYASSSYLFKMEDTSYFSNAEALLK